MLRKLRVLRGRPGRAHVQPQQASATYCRRLVSARREGAVGKVGGITDLLHGPSEVVICRFDGPVYVLLACDLVAHFEAFVVEHFVRFFDLVGGVVDRHPY